MRAPYLEASPSPLPLLLSAPGPESEATAAARSTCSIRTSFSLADEWPATGHADDVGIDASNRVIDVVHVRLLDLYQHLLADLKRQRPLLDLLWLPVSTSSKVSIGKEVPPSK